MRLPFKVGIQVPSSSLDAVAKAGSRVTRNLKPHNRRGLKGALVS